MLGNRQEIAWLKSDFYRYEFRKILRWLIISISLVFILLAAIIYTIFFQPPVIYYANTVDGKILDMPTPRV